MTRSGHFGPDVPRHSASIAAKKASSIGAGLGEGGREVGGVECGDDVPAQGWIGCGLAKLGDGFGASDGGVEEVERARVADRGEAGEERDQEGLEYGDGAAVA